VVKKRGQDLTTLKAGDCFGEMGYLARSRRTATISALNDVRILRINETQMEQAQDSVQARFNKVFLKTLVRRLEKTSDELTNQSASQDNGAGDSREYPTGHERTGVPLVLSDSGRVS
jgi:CRP-like cAMP-binding protein